MKVFLRYLLFFYLLFTFLLFGYSTPTFTSSEIVKILDSEVYWDGTSNQIRVINKNSMSGELNSYSSTYCSKLGSISQGNEFCMLFAIPKNEDNLFYSIPFLSSQSGTSLSSYKYYPSIDIQASKCEVTHGGADLLSGIVQVNSNLNDFKFYFGPNALQFENFPVELETAMETNYYMKNLVFLELEKKSGSAPYDRVYIFPNEVEKDASGNLKFYKYSQYSSSFVNALNNHYFSGITESSGSYVYYDGDLSGYDPFFAQNAFYYDSGLNIPSSTSNRESYMPYALVKPGISQFTFDLEGLKILLEVYGGEYDVKLNSFPIDGKCDINNDNKVETAEADHFDHDLGVLNVDMPPIDDDGDGFLENTNLLVTDPLKDNCPTEYGDYHGCPEALLPVGCSENSNFKIEGTTLVCDKPWSILRNSIYVEFKPSGGSYNEVYRDDSYPIRYDISRGQGSYRCKFDRPWPLSDDNLGSCSFMITTPYFCDGPNGEVVPDNKSMRFYKYNNILESELEDSNVYKDFKCGENSDVWESGVDFTYFKYSSPNIVEEDYGLMRDFSTGLVFYNDSFKNGKVKCNLDLDFCSVEFSESGVFRSYSVYNVSDYQSSSNNKGIKTYRNGQLDSFENLNPAILLMTAHKVSNFRNVLELKDFLVDSLELMNKFEIIRELDYNEVLNHTRVKIRFSSEFTSERDLVLYQILPEQEGSVDISYDDIEVNTMEGVTRLVLDKDPVIGWHFNDSGSGTGGVDYNLSGNVSGGGVFVVEEPVLFNEGEVIITYREGQTGCLLDEAHMFDLEGLDNSSILSKNTGLYQICISYIDSNINIRADDSHITDLKVSTFDWNGMMSVSGFDLSEDLILSTNSSDIYWDLRIQEENPNGNYTCLGSINSKTMPSVFGDCLFKPENRLWIHLGADYIPPKMDMDIPYLSHTAKFVLKAYDNIGGSGIEEIRYSIDGTSYVETFVDSYFNYNLNMSLTCPGADSCVSVVKAQTCDFAGLCSENYEWNVSLLEQGSACFSDCSAKPVPGRYVNSCNLLNGCEFYKYDNLGIFDDGVYTSNICNYQALGSYVNFNSTHEILCPNGPFRQTKFSSEKVEFHTLNDDDCEDLIIKEKQVVIEGQSLTMKILFCQN